MIKKIFLIGNPNVGKSVLFSRLTGVRVITSNYPGTTVEITKGFLDIEGEQIEVVDLPGVYSLDAASSAEKVVESFLAGMPAEESVVINVIDATNLERNLYLTLELMERGYRLLVALNMCDDMRHRGITIDSAVLSGLLGMPVVSTCAVTGGGVKQLVAAVPLTQPRAARALSHEDRWVAIGRIVEQVQQLAHRHHTLRERLEDLSVGPVSGLVIAAAIIAGAFKVIRFLGEALIAVIADPWFEGVYRPVLEKLSAALGQRGFWHHLLIGELINGRIDFRQSLGLLTTAPYIEFAMVLPYIISFYFVLGVLEDVGFLPRLAMVLDSFFHKLGLHGFAIIPILLGFGCNVPGLLSTRVLESKRERFIAATLISIGVPCVPLQAMIFGLLGAFGGFYVTGVYLILFFLWIVIGMLLNRTLKGYSPEFLLEIPPYRYPPLGLLAHKLFVRIRGFIIEAVPVVLIGVLIVNTLLYFSLFEVISRATAPVISGIFGLPKEAIVALTIGLFRKDVAVGMLVPLSLSAKQLFIAAVLLAISFPCIATFVVFLKELGWRSLVGACAIMAGTALVVGALLNIFMAG